MIGESLVGAEEGQNRRLSLDNVPSSLCIIRNWTTVQYPARQPRRSTILCLLLQAANGCSLCIDKNGIPHFPRYDGNTLYSHRMPNILFPVRTVASPCILVPLVPLELSSFHVPRTWQTIVAATQLHHEAREKGSGNKNPSRETLHKVSSEGCIYARFAGVCWVEPPVLSGIDLGDLEKIVHALVGCPTNYLQYYIRF